MFHNSISEEVHLQVMHAKQRIEQFPFPGFTEAVPAYTSLAIHFQPELTETTSSISITVQQYISALLTQPIAVTEQQPERLIDIPVCYDETLAPDLADTARQLQLTTQELISIHLSKTYRVYMLGFTPGFPYLGKLDERIITQRKQQPRLAVAPGSVAIAGEQTGIYPFATPGGWNIIGQTPVQLFNRSSENPFLLRAGDNIQFKQITLQEFYTLSSITKKSADS